VYSFICYYPMELYIKSHLMNDSSRQVIIYDMEPVALPGSFYIIESKRYHLIKFQWRVFHAAGTMYSVVQLSHLMSPDSNGGSQNCFHNLR